MLDPEAESAELKQRSAELAQLLDAGHPVVGGCPDVMAESKRLAAAAHQARRKVAGRVAAGLPVDCPVGTQPPLRRVRTDARGKDLDPLGGRSVVSPEILRYWEHRRDVVFPAVEAMYTRAAEETPYREALVAAARAHIALLRERQMLSSEGGVDVEVAMAKYDEAYRRLRQGKIDAQDIASEAVERLASLRRIAASLELGDRDEVKPFLASAIATATDAPLFDPASGMPLERVDATTEAKRQRAPAVTYRPADQVKAPAVTYRRD
jgi:hypothetical protein